MSVTWYEIRLRDNFSSQLKQAEKRADEFEKKISQMQNQLKNLGGAAGNTGSIMAGVFGGMIGANVFQRIVSGIKQVTAEVVSLGFEMERTRITMKTLLGGDANFSNGMIGDFQMFAKETPFSTKEVVEGAKRLAAYQFQAEQMIPTLKKLGDVSSGLGLNLNDLIWVYGTTKVAGKVNSRDIRQFQDRGIPISEYIAKATGKSQKEVLGDLKDISFKDVSKAFDLMTSKGGPFFNLMDQLSKSIGGKWERLKDNVEIIMTDWGERMLPDLGEMIDLTDRFVTAFDNVDWSEWSVPIHNIWEDLKDIGTSFSDAFNLEEILGVSLDLLKQMSKELLFTINIATASIDYALQRAAAAGTKATGPLLKSQESWDAFSKWTKENPGKDYTFENIFDSKVNKAYDTRQGRYDYSGQNVFGKSQNIIPTTDANTGKYTDANGVVWNGRPKPSSVNGEDQDSIGMEKIHSATRNITINIDTLVDKITFEQSIQDNSQAVVDAVKRVLLTAVNDVNLVSSGN